MVLYCRVSLNAFVESFRNTSGPDSFFTLPAKGLMHIVPQEEIEYGLSLLRESIGLYEERKGIPVEKSKKAIQPGQPDAGGAGDRHVRDPFV